MRGGLYSLPRTQDDKTALELADKDIAAEHFADAVERLQKLVIHGGSAVVPSRTPKLFVGSRFAAIEKLRELDPRGREAYEKLVQREAGAFLRTPFLELKKSQLTTLAEEFPTSHLGVEARLRLGDLALEEGEGLTASEHYRSAKDAMSAADSRQESLQRRRAAARALLGSQFGTRRGENAFPPRNEIEKAARAQLEPVLCNPPNERIGWPEYGGGGAGRLTMTRPLGKTKQRWEWQLGPAGFDGMRSPMHLVGGIGGIYACDGQSLHALDPLSGQSRWRGDGPMLEEQQDEVREYEDAINQSMILGAALAEDVAVVGLQVPNDLEGASHNMRFSRFAVISRIPSRRLFAFDRATGKRLWAHWDQRGGAVTNRYQGHDVAGPPMIVGDTVFAATHDQTGAIQYYLSAYDLQTGRPKWRKLICSSQLEVNMFGNAQQEFAAAPLALEDGVIYATTNLGVCYAADADTGRIRWISAYDVIPMPQTQLTNQMPRPVYFANNPGVLLDDVFVCTPLDSAWVLAFEAGTGKQLWKLNQAAQAGGVEAQIHWMLGCIGDEIVFSGRGIVAVQAHPETVRNQAQARLVASPEMLGTSGRHAPSIPRGVISEDLIWFPSPTGLRVVDREGVLDPRATDIEPVGAGNLLLQDGILFTARQSSIEVHMDREALIREAERATRQSPDDAFAWLRLAILVRASASRELQDAIAERAEGYYRSGLQAISRQGLDSSSPVGKRLSEGLFQITFARAEAAARISPDSALPLLRRARDEAPDANSWIGAQLLIIRLLELENRNAQAELVRLAEKHGAALHTFPDAGRIPVAAYALWRGIALEKTPEGQALRCQELLERFPELTIAGESVRDFVSRRLATLLESHGAKIYAPIEERAAQTLEKARKDKDAGTSGLWWVVETYPHSEAARRANLALVDDALARNDGATALRIFGQSLRAGRYDARQLRRAMVAASLLGNKAFEARLVRQALERERGKATEWPADAGKPIEAAVSMPEVVDPARVRARPRAPQTVLARLPAPGSGLYTQKLVELVDVVGFAPVKEDLFLVWSTGDKLACFDLAKGGGCFDAPRFEITFAPPTERPIVWRAGSRLVLVESTRARGIDCKDGTEQWSLEAPERRTFRCLSLHGGIARIWCESRDIDDGGQVLAVEPASGALLSRVVFEGTRPSTPPLFVGGEMLALDLDGEGMAILRYDDLTGSKLGSIRPEQAVQKQLGMQEPAMARARGEDLARRFFADEATIYLPSSRTSASEAPHLQAIDRSGRRVWSWTGSSGRTLDVAGIVDSLLVIVEGSGDRGGSVVLLAKADRSVKLERKLTGRVRVIGWRNPQQPPTALLVTDTAPQLRLFFHPLQEPAPGSPFEPVPPFEHDVGRGAQDILEDPILGDGCLVLPLRPKSPTSLSLVALDLRDARKDLLLEFGPKATLGLKPPFQLSAAGPYIALSSDREITLFGTSDSARSHEGKR